MTARPRLWVLVILLLGVGLVEAGTARAEFGPIELLSKSPLEQANSAGQPAVSADGNYVAFSAELGGRAGIFREDLHTGTLVAVATKVAYEEGPGFSAPSISADGRYISFTTTAPLDPTEDPQPGSSDVYVADMATSPPTYELASARDESTMALTYAEPGMGSQAATGVALSADGREVAFAVESESDLDGAPGATEAPADQVVVRNLESDRTTLVSVERDPLTGKMTSQPVAGGAIAAGELPSISADGTTVAWYGTHIAGQSPTADEVEPTGYGEPLWRRIALGVGAPTRRIAGGSGAFFSGQGGACEPSPGWIHIGVGPPVSGQPQLSSDGEHVALLGAPGGFADAYLADMGQEPAALRQLTRVIPIEQPCSTGDPGNIPDAGPITSIAFASGERRIAFTTARQRFPLNPPNLLTTAPPQVGLTELFEIDLQGETLRRLTPAVLGEASSKVKGNPGEIGATEPSLSADGLTVAFSSTASNLVRGDANEASDVFALADTPAPEGRGTVAISPVPAAPQAKVLWRLTASAVSLRDGKVRVRAVVPGSGMLVGKALARVGPKLATRQVAGARRRGPGGGVLLLTLAPKRGYRRLTHLPGGLAATIHLRFRGPGGKPLAATVTASFRTAKGGAKRGSR